MVKEQWCDTTDGCTDGGGGGGLQYPRFFFEKRGDKDAAELTLSTASEVILLVARAKNCLICSCLFTYLMPQTSLLAVQ